MVYMQITLVWLQEQGACSQALREFTAHFPDGAPLPDVVAACRSARAWSWGRWLWREVLGSRFASLPAPVQVRVAITLLEMPSQFEAWQQWRAASRAAAGAAYAAMDAVRAAADVAMAAPSVAEFATLLEQVIAEAIEAEARLTEVTDATS